MSHDSRKPASIQIQVQDGRGQGVYRHLRPVFDRGRSGRRLPVDGAKQAGGPTESQAELSRQVRDLEDFEKKLAELKAKKDIVARKSEVVENLRRDRDKMVRLLAVLAVSTPVDQIWFERLQESGNGVTITGTAKSDDAIVEFMRNLEASPYIAPGSVSLRHSRKKGDLRDFQLSCGFVPYSAVQQKLKAAASPSEKKKADGTKVN